MTRAWKWHYMTRVYPRYHKASRKEKKKILDEFCKTYRCHRKHAIRLLNGPPPPDQRPSRKPRRPRYSPALLELLRRIWEATGYLWSRRLKAALPIWMPWIRRRFRLTPDLEKQLLKISPAQIDRRLAPVKRRLRKKIYGVTKPGTLLKHHIPIKTEHWDVKTPGYLEIDLVSHSGTCAAGDFAHTLDTTDIKTTWSERRAVLGKGQRAVCQSLDEIEEALPFKTLGLDCDNGSEFINHHLLTHCQERKIQLTRGRPYKKDDNAHIEQRNWTHVRKLFGYVRYDTQDVVDLLNDLYRHELRDFQNFFQPSVKLLKKIRKGSKTTRVYEEPKTPWHRVLACPQHDPVKVAALQAHLKELDPFELARILDKNIQAIFEKRSLIRPTPAPLVFRAFKDDLPWRDYSPRPLPEDRIGPVPFIDPDRDSLVLKLQRQLQKEASLLTA